MRVERTRAKKSGLDRSALQNQKRLERTDFQGRFDVRRSSIPGGQRACGACSHGKNGNPADVTPGLDRCVHGRNFGMVGDERYTGSTVWEYHTHCPTSPRCVEWARHRN
jgi:hypothetical protein